MLRGRGAMRFEDRVAIVTGGYGGIGLATAKRLGSEGCKVVIAGVDESKAEDAARGGIAFGTGQAIGIACDVTDEAQVERTVDVATDLWGRLDVVVNNAGLMVFKPIVEHTVEDWLRIMKVDLIGAFLFTKQAFLRMKPGGA